MRPGSKPHIKRDMSSDKIKAILDEQDSCGTLHEESAGESYVMCPIEEMSLEKNGFQNLSSPDHGYEQPGMSSEGEVDLGRCEKMNFSPPKNLKSGASPRKDVLYGKPYKMHCLLHVMYQI